MTDLRLIIKGLQKGLSQRTLVRKLKITCPTIKIYVDRIMSSGLSLEKILKLNDKEFNALLRSPKKEYSPDKRKHPMKYRILYKGIVNSIHI